LYEAQVQEAIRTVIARDPQYTEGQSLPEDRWESYAEAVTAELSTYGVCATKTVPPKPSKEEVGVWLDGGQREHWDIVVGPADRIGQDQLFLAWVCKHP
jgi:hypothetical protein